MSEESGDRSAPRVGSVAQETARLLDALMGSAAPVGSAEGVEDRPQAGEEPKEGNEPDGRAAGPEDPARTAGGPAPDQPCPTCGHTDGPAHGDVCRLCPVCQLLRVARAVRPETLDRLADLAGAVTEALRDAAAARSRESSGSHARPPRAPGPVVEDIPVGDADSDTGSDADLAADLDADADVDTDWTDMDDDGEEAR